MPGKHSAILLECAWGFVVGYQRLGIFLALMVLVATCQTTVPLRGQVVSSTPAADFELTSQSAQTIHLAEFQGRVVVLAFLDTDCTGDCPGITSKLIETADQIDSSEAGRVAFLAVTTAPDVDTVGRAAQFCNAKGTPSNFYFLTGGRPQVEAVWTSYTHPESAAALPDKLVLIDPIGQVRSYMSTSSLAAEDLRHNIRTLLAEENLLALPLCH